MKVATTFGLIVLAAASPALAQFSHTENITAVNYWMRTRDNAGSTLWGLQDPNVAFGMSSTFDINWNLTSNDFEPAVNASSSFVGGTAFDADRVAYQWTLDSTVELSRTPVGTEAYTYGQATAFFSSTFTVTENTTLRFEYGGAGSDSNVASRLFQIPVSVSTSGSSFTPLSFGVNVGALITGPTVFEIPVSAGEVIQIESATIFPGEVFNSVNAPLMNTQAAYLDFAITAVPAPSTAALFAASGMALVRRRRF